MFSTSNTTVFPVRLARNQTAARLRHQQARVTRAKQTQSMNELASYAFDSDEGCRYPRNTQWLSLIRMSASGIDFENPHPNHESFGTRDSPTGCVRIAANDKYKNTDFQLAFNFKKKRKENRQEDLLIINTRTAFTPAN